MQYDVFLSYSVRDKATADAACSVLESQGIRCWVAPRDIRPGETWGSAIISAIEASRVLVLIFSNHSNTSPQVMREVERAIQKGLVIIPFRIEAVVPSGNMEYFLSTTHWLDALGPDLDLHIEQLAKSVKSFLSSDPPLKTKEEATPASRDAEDVKKNSNVAFNIHFSANRYGLFLGSGVDGDASVQEDQYILCATPGRYMGTKLTELPKLSEFVLESRITKLAGPESPCFGFEFGDWYPGNYYQFLLSGNGEIRISKHWKNKWHDLYVSLENSCVRKGNSKNLLKVVKRGSSIHFWVNNFMVASVQDEGIRTGLLGMLVGPEVQAGFSGCTIRGVDLRPSFEKAIHHWNRLEMPEAKDYLHQLERLDPMFRTDHFPVSVSHLIWAMKMCPDHRKTILLVIGHEVEPQIYDGVAAHRLREEINQRGNRDKWEFATIVSDTGVLRNDSFMKCPIIAIGGPIANKVTQAISQELIRDSSSTDGTEILHSMEKGDKRIVLQGPLAEDTSNAVDLFISSGVLDRFLKMLWGHGGQQIGSTTTLDTSERDVPPDVRADITNVK